MAPPAWLDQRSPTPSAHSQRSKRRHHHSRRSRRQDLSADALDLHLVKLEATALYDVTTAIADVANQRGAIGANINELNAASNVASAESVNLTSAESSITATNYGQATSDLAKFQVLSQTGISALAQANSVQQEVLKLLQ